MILPCTDNGPNCLLWCDPTQNEIRRAVMAAIAGSVGGNFPITPLHLPTRDEAVSTCPPPLSGLELRHWRLNGVTVGTKMPWARGSQVGEEGMEEGGGLALC